MFLTPSLRRCKSRFSRDLLSESSFQFINLFYSLYLVNSTFEIYELEDFRKYGNITCCIPNLGPPTLIWLCNSWKLPFIPHAAYKMVSFFYIFWYKVMSFFSPLFLPKNLTNMHFAIFIQSCKIFHICPLNQGGKGHCFSQ